MPAPAASSGASRSRWCWKKAGPNSAAAGFAVDYLEARHALTLAPVASLKDGPIRLLVAAKLGKTRLIDNLAV